MLEARQLAVFGIYHFSWRHGPPQMLLRLDYVNRYTRTGKGVCEYRWLGIIEISQQISQRIAEGGAIQAEIQSVGIYGYPFGNLGGKQIVEP